MKNNESWRWQRGVRRVGAAATIAAVAATMVSVPMAAADDGSGSSLTTLISGTTSSGSPTRSFRRHDEFTAQPSTRAQSLGDVAKAIRSDKATGSDANGHGIDVALVDTGVAEVVGLDDPATVVNGPDLSLDYQVGAPVGIDGYGHGTHLAGIIAGRGDATSRGIAPGARLLNMKVGAADGSVDVSQVIAAIDWTVQHRRDPGMNVRVLNLSFGTDALQSYQLDPLAHAVESAWRNNIVVVVAAGNSGAALTNPAIDPYVITVGAANTGDPDNRGDDVVADFSSIGDSTRGVDVVAPGVSIISSVDAQSNAAVNHPEALVTATTIKGSGTSQAAAVISAAVADLLSARPASTPDQIKSLLKSTASYIYDTAPGSQGAGLINVNAALTWLPLSFLRPAQNFARSTGLGSLELARGGNHLATPDGVELTGEFDISDNPWVPTTWAPLATQGHAWADNTWNGAALDGTGWADATDGLNTARSTWRGSTWRGSTWRGSTWRGSTWRGSTWRAMD